MTNDAKTQHTPGFEPRYCGMEIIEAAGKFIIRDRNNGAFFASTYSWVDSRLIAAAPELLEALNLMLIKQEGRIIDEAGKIEAQARAAIAKAWGRA